MFSATRRSDTAATFLGSNAPATDYAALSLVRMLPIFLQMYHLSDLYWLTTKWHFSSHVLTFDVSAGLFPACTALDYQCIWFSIWDIPVQYRHWCKWCMRMCTYMVCAYTVCAYTERT